MKVRSGSKAAMTFPESERLVFEQNPLEEVICQLRFPPILAISVEQPAPFQNKIRSEYPLYRVDQPAVPSEIGEILARLPVAVPFAEAVTHRFSTEDGSKSISLASDFVAFSDKKYTHWGVFSREVERARRALEEIYRPAFYVRTGLRYRDVIDPEKLNLKGDDWETLLKPSLLGLLGAEDVGDHIGEIMTQASVNLDEVPGARATIRHGLRRQPDGKRVYVIDMDTYTEEKHESQHVADVLAKFNRVAGNFFRWAITDRLRVALGPRPIPDA